MAVQKATAVDVKPYRFSVAEFDRMGEVGIFTEDDRVELIEGEIFEMSPIGSRHAACVYRANQLFFERIGRSALIGDQNPVHLGNRSEPQPDVVLLRPRPDFYAAGHPTAADILLIVEVSDTTLKFDRETKIPMYARQGVVEVWLEALDDDAIYVYRDPSPDGYRTIVVAHRGDVLAPLAFPSAEIAVTDLLG